MTDKAQLGPEEMGLLYMGNKAKENVKFPLYTHHAFGDTFKIFFESKLKIELSYFLIVAFTLFF